VLAAPADVLEQLALAALEAIADRDAYREQLQVALEQLTVIVRGLELTPEQLRRALDLARAKAAA
jgi:hypothetical protein